MEKTASTGSAVSTSLGDEGRGVHAGRGDLPHRARRVLGLAALLSVLAACTPSGSSESSALVVDDWGGKVVSALCVGGEEDYGSGPNAVTPVQEGIAALLGGIVVDEGCEATITVSLIGEAHSATYENPDSPGSQLLLYTGAGVQGTMSLTADGPAPLTALVRGYLAPPQSIAAGAGASRDPSGAPFWGAAYGEVCRVLQQWFGADDPRLSHCPEPAAVAFTTLAGHTPWPEALRGDFLDGCVNSESVCLCLLYGAETVLSEADWLAVRDLDDISLWPEDLRARLGPIWSDCSP